MKYKLIPTVRFQKDLKRLQKRGYNMTLMTDVLKKLADGEVLPAKTEIISFPEIGEVAVSAIFPQTGFLYMRSQPQN